LHINEQLSIKIEELGAIVYISADAIAPGKAADFQAPAPNRHPSYTNSSDYMDE
jgi:hypothetical protein